MKTEKTDLEYLQPKLKVMEVTAKKVLCQSPEFGSINDMSRDEEEGI